MKVIFKPVAVANIAAISSYIDTINIEGSGDRWAVKLDSFLRSYAKPNVTYSLCKHHSLSRYNYQCIAYRDWVIAFLIVGNRFEVRRIIHGSRLG